MAAKSPANKKITDDVIEFAEFALAQGFLKGVVKALLKEKYELCYRSCETVITQARKKLLERAELSHDELRRDSFQIYDAISRDPAYAARERMLARERIDKLFGLEGPIKLQHSGEINTTAERESMQKLMRTPEGRALLERLDDLQAVPGETK
jgi:hypothetical protein